MADGAEHWADGPEALLNEWRYREYVLQLTGSNAEEDGLEQLRRDALELGLTVEDDSRGPKNDQKPAGSKAVPSVDVSDTQLTNQSSTSSTTSTRVSSSAHSVTSLATCPTSLSSSDARHRLSISDGILSRHSVDLSYFQDHRSSAGFRQSIFSKFPYFRKRLSVPAALPSQSQSTANRSQGFGFVGGPGREPEIMPPPAAPSPTHQPDSDAKGIVDEEAVARSLSCCLLTTLREMHHGQKRRYLCYRTELLRSIDTENQILIEEKRTQNAENESARKEQNTLRAERLELRDLNAELSLVEELEREKQGLQIRIRHMEAYFNSPPPTISGGNNDIYATFQPREFTNQKRSRLSQCYHELSRLDVLHESKIKVLRNTQARKYQEELKNMESDAIKLSKENQLALQAFKARRQNLIMAAEAWLDGKREKLLCRWALEERIARKRLEIETKLAYGALPPITFDKSDFDSETSN